MRYSVNKGKKGREKKVPDVGVGVGEESRREEKKGGERREERRRYLMWEWA
jgi:hypothetical protein